MRGTELVEMANLHNVVVGYILHEITLSAMIVWIPCSTPSGIKVLFRLATNQECNLGIEKEWSVNLVKVSSKKSKSFTKFFS
jgi:hypothetical protein